MNDMRNWDLSPQEFFRLQLSTCQISNYLLGSPLRVPFSANCMALTSEWDAFHDLIVIDEIARCGYLGVNWGLSCGNAIGCPPIINYGTPSQKQRFLPPILRGEKRMCLAITEPLGRIPQVLA